MYVGNGKGNLMRKTVDRILPSKELDARLMSSYLNSIPENTLAEGTRSIPAIIVSVVTLIILIGVIIKIIWMI